MRHPLLPVLFAISLISTPAMALDIAAVQEVENGRCPTYVAFKDHSHLSQGYSVGTTDTSVSGPIVEFLLKVK